MEWKHLVGQGWAWVGHIVDVFGRIGFIVATISAATAMIWAWFQNATAPFILPAGTLSFAAVLWIAKEVRGVRSSPSRRVDAKDDRLEELIGDSGMVRTPTEFAYWIEAISQWIYIRIGPDEFGEPFQNTLAGIQTDLYEVGVERSVQRVLEFLKTIR